MDLKKLNPIAKTVAAVLAGLGTVVALFVTLSADGVLSSEDVIALLVGIVGAISGSAAVYQVPNKSVDGSEHYPAE